jgi:hypothetical protein
LSDTRGQTGSRFVFEINEDDDRIFRKAITRDLRRYFDRRIITGIPLLVFIGLGAALFVAMQRGYVSPAVGFTYEVTFLIGYFVQVIAAHIALPRMQRALFKDIPAANRRFDFAFDDDKIVVKIGLKETPMPWAAIARVEDIRSMVIFWYQPTQGFYVPRGAFSDDAARTTFAAWAAARVQAAGMNAVAAAPD